jgi:hypothetical protein
VKPHNRSHPRNQKRKPRVAEALDHDRAGGTRRTTNMSRLLVQCLDARLSGQMLVLADS